MAALDGGSLQLLRGHAHPGAGRQSAGAAAAAARGRAQPQPPVPSDHAGRRAGRLRGPHHRPAVPAARSPRSAARPAFVPERGRGLRDDRAARQPGHARACLARLRGRAAGAAPRHPRVVEGWLDIYAAGLAQRRAGRRRGGAGLRLGHQRIHAQPRRLRRDARMRPAPGPGGARRGPRGDPLGPAAAGHDRARSGGDASAGAFAAAAWSA